MRTYILLANWTAEGMKTVRDTVQRGQDARDLLQRMGGEVKALYWTPGPYNIVAILDAPDDDTVATVALAITSRGTTRATIVRAFDENTVSKLLARLPA
jgi:uncharacterized protein with GYD domain